MPTGLRMLIHERKKRTARDRKQIKRQRSSSKNHSKKSIPRRAVNAVLDSNKYRISQYTNPTLWTGVTLGAGVNEQVARNK